MSGAQDFDASIPVAATGAATPSRRRWNAGGRLALALAAMITMTALGTPAVRADGDDLVEISRSTFRLLPRKDRVEVTVDLSLTNRRPSIVRVVPCPGAPSMRCRQRVSYYFDRWGYLIVQSGARKVRFAGAGVRARVARRGAGWMAYLVRFPRTQFGQTRRVRITYRLPAGRPRSATPTRITDAYAHLCWHGQPTDRGTVTAILPGGYETQTYGGKVRTQASRRRTVVRAKNPRAVARFAVCTDAFDAEKLQRTETLSPSGQRIIVEGWPEDPTWTSTVTDGLGETLPRLEDIIGIAFPQDGIVVRQVAIQALGGYAGDFIPRRGQIRVAESLDDPALVAHELAHAWFSFATLGDLWLIEGYAEWAGTTAAGQGCSDAGDYPVKGSPRLGRWRLLGAKPSRTDRAVIEYQYAAACSLIAEVAVLVGPHRMRELTAAVLLRSPKYGGAAGVRPDERAPTPDWREWLDAVDELGLVPAGWKDLELAERLLLQQGIARPRDLRGRSEARAAYHAAIGQHGSRLPGLIGRLMDEWRFAPALKAVGTADVTLRLLDEAEMAGADPSDIAGLRARLAAVSSLRELRAIRGEARRLAPAADAAGAADGADPGSPVR